jgi:drug/metabolite transporter (DMT)-like permease
MAAMRLFVLTALAMCAFAANSVLNRMAVGPGLLDPITFAIIRLLSGAGMLALLLALRAVRGGALWPGWRGRGAGVAGLLVYLFGFSLAYLSLGAGVGALILFGAVQVTMFAGAILSREAVPGRRWLGAGLAFAGLVVLMAPGGGAAVPSLSAGAFMAFAGVGWGIYSLAGRGAADALGATAWNFVLAVPVALALLPVLSVDAGAVPMAPLGVALAVLSGAVTSGLGYALWYALVPGLGASRAGVAQLTVPLIAAGGGALLIGEGVGLRFALAAALVLGGVALASVQSGFFSRKRR